MAFPLQRALVALAAIAVAGCTTVPADRGYSDVRQQSTDRGLPLPDDVNADRSTFVSEILAHPLTADDALRMAFANNPHVQIEYARLGLSAAEVVRAGRLSNPTLAASWQSSSASGDADRYTFGLTQNFAELLLLSARTCFSKGEFERAKLDVTQALLDLAASVQSAYYAAVGAHQVAAMRERVAAAATATAALSQRFKDAGNTTALELAMQEAAASEAMLEQERADLEVSRTESMLNELMGLDAAAQWNIADSLPMPVREEDSLDALQTLALARADLDSDRRAVVLLEDALGLTRSYRFIGDVEVGAQYERDTDRNRLIGPSLSLQLPLFNQGQAAMLRAESLLDAARAEVRAKEIEISNAVGAANERVLAMRRRIDRLRNETIPLREQIVARMQEQQNYMLVDIFDLLRTKQDEYNTYQQYVESVSAYWLARVDLAHAVGSRLPSDDLIGAAIVAPDLQTQPSTSPNATPADALDSPSIPPDHNYHGE